MTEAEPAQEAQESRTSLCLHCREPVVREMRGSRFRWVSDKSRTCRERSPIGEHVRCEVVVRSGRVTVSLPGFPWEREMFAFTQAIACQVLNVVPAQIRRVENRSHEDRHDGWMVVHVWARRP